MNRLEDIEKRLHPILERENESRRLESLVPRARAYIGVSGVLYSGPARVIIEDVLTIRQVTNPPGVIHVCRAAAPSASDYLGVARFSDAIQCEILVGQGLSSDEPRDLGTDLAWQVAVMLRIQGYRRLLCPAMSTRSWDLVASASEKSVSFRLLDDIPRMVLVAPIKSNLDDAALTWLSQNWERCLELRNSTHSRRFGLALNIAYSWSHTSEPRVALGMLWAGLDALFGIQTDRPVTGRLIERIAAWLPTTSSERIRELYNTRSSAVHGRLIPESDVAITLAETSDLLNLSLVKAVETGTKTLADW